MQALSESHQNPQQMSSSGSESEPSPAFASSEYFNMMQQSGADNSSNENFSKTSQGQYHEAASLPQDIPLPASEPNDQFQEFDFHQAQSDLFDSPQDLNRRTLTQEQFNAMSQQSVMQGSGGFTLDMDVEALNKMYPDYSQPDMKSQEAYDFPAFSGLPDSHPGASLPQAVANHSMPGFPSSNAMQAQSVVSSASSDWGGSRSSSISTFSRESQIAPSAATTQPQAATASSQWRPGQSVPVDFNQLSEEFRQIAQSRQPQQQYMQEQPLAWPVDEAYRERRESQTASITQSMSNVGIKTPQPSQHAAFQSPAPATSLATRRQRSKPTPLGLASLRSQSYSAASQPGSPGNMSQTHHQQQNSSNPGPAQPLRRIKSSNMINGVAQGRIQKAVPGSAQRSPLNWTFADVMNSPKGMRSMSTSNGSSLAPPTPMSPREQARQTQQWQSSSGQVSRQASISETDLEQGAQHVPATGPTDNISSPPHTPMYPPQPPFAQQRVGKNTVTENTPPQSAPATQLCFSNNSFMPPPPPNPVAQHQVTTMPPPQAPQQAMQHMFSAHAPQMMPPESHFAMGDMGMAQPNFAFANPDPMANAHMQFPMGGVPMVDANGNFQMAMPQPHYQLVSHPPPMPSASAPPLNHTPPMHFPFPATASPPPGLHMPNHGSHAIPQPELFVHEYQPPADVKRAATPRKVPAESGPKSYTFANQTPEHFEKGKKGAAAASTSPSSNSS